MSSLSSQQINDSYQGLLKLADSTTGITSTLQSVQDGLGNDTGLVIGTDYLGGSGIVSCVRPEPKGGGGPGITSGTGTAFGSGSINLLQSLLFYDRGGVSYSSITFGVGTLSSTQDVIQFAIYDGQYASTAGYQPKQRITEILTIPSGDTSTTGFYTYNFSANTSFEKGGYYFLCLVVTNPTSVAPTVRLRTPIQATSQGIFAGMMLGFVLGNAGGGYINAFNAGSTTQIGQLYGGISGALVDSYSVATLLAGISTTAQSLGGFVLNPVI